MFKIKPASDKRKPMPNQNTNASDALRYCIVFDQTAKQPDFISLHVVTELTAASYVICLYWEFTVLLLLSRALILNYVKNRCNLLFE